MHKLKTYSSLFLLLLVALPLVYITILQVQEQINRHQMMERLEEEALQTISIPVQKLIWVKRGKEILVGDKRFDVKEIIFKNNLAIVTGLFDEEEEAIMKKMNRHHSSQQIAMFKIWFPVFQNVHREPNTVIPVRWLKNKYLIDCKLTLPTTLLHVITPPPKA